VVAALGRQEPSVDQAKRSSRSAVGGRETVQYVANIHKYTIAYKLIEQQERERQQLRVEP
jgi:hypothetical protein